MSRKIDLLIAKRVFNIDVIGEPLKYSTDLMEAIKIADVIGHLGLNFEDGEWDAVFLNKAMYHKTAPMAICLSALRADGMDHGDLIALYNEVSEDKRYG